MDSNKQTRAISRRATILGFFLCVAGYTSSPYTLLTHPDSLRVSFDTSLINRLEPYESARSAGFVGWAPQGMLIARREGDFAQLFLLRAPGGKPRPVSDFKDRIDRFNANPDPNRGLMLITRDFGGDEQYRPFLYRWDKRRETPWPAPPGRVSEIVWSRDGKSFAYAHTPPGASQWDIRVGSLPDRDRLVLRRPGAWTPQDFSADGKELLLLHEISASETELWKLSLIDTVLARVLPNDSPQSFGNAFFLNPKRGKPVLAFNSDRGGEFQRLYRWRWGDSLPEAISTEEKGDVEWVLPSPDRRRLIYSVNQNGISRIHKVGLSGLSKPELLSGIPEGMILPGVFRPGSSAASMVLINTATPGDVYEVGGKTLIWARGERALPEDSAELHEFQFPTFDSADGELRNIPAFMLSPPKRWPAPHPVLIQIHGGPELQARPGYDPFLRFCVRELGLTVIEPNVRGSTGYGKSYQKLDDGRKRPDTVRDLGALIDWIGKQPDLDSSRVAVMGRSYGGFMALSALVNYGHRLRAGISGVGISHFPSFLEGTAGYRRDLRRVEYGDERDSAMRAFLDSLSPLSRAGSIRTPLLLSHGRNDPRVPLEQSEKMFAALEKGPAETWLFVLEGEGHGLKLKSQETLYHAIAAQFLARHLGL